MKTRIFVADRIHTMNPRAGGRALVVENGRIRAVASINDARRLAPAAEILEFGGGTVTPGLTDSHIHLLEWAISRAQVDLSGAATIQDAARLAAQGKRRHGWLLGRGWNAHQWGGEAPHRSALDAAVPDAAVVLQSHDMHALWLNTRALQHIGVTGTTPDPAGGRIARDANGEPTGVLLENAAQLVVPHLPAYGIDELAAIVTDAQHELHSYGITGVHSFPGVHLTQPRARAVLDHMRNTQRLSLRILQHIALDELDDAMRAGIRSGDGDSWIRSGGVKMFLDGALGSRTAWMRAPYENSTDCGVRVMLEDDFRGTVAEAARHGISSVVHAIGDAAVTLAFDVLTDRAVQNTALPHRVEHVQCLPADRAHLVGKGVACSVQPSHLMTDWRAADRHWGARAADTYAFRRMLDHHASLAFGSDAPVEAADPRHGLFAAVTRIDLSGTPRDGWYPAERLTPLEALAGYTTGPAAVGGVAPELAGLVPGALADFVIWKQDPLNIEPAALLALTPAATVVDGEIVFGS